MYIATESPSLIQSGFIHKTLSVARYLILTSLWRTLALRQQLHVLDSPELPDCIVFLFPFSFHVLQSSGLYIPQTGIFKEFCWFWKSPFLVLINLTQNNN